MLGKTWGDQKPYGLWTEMQNGGSTYQEGPAVAQEVKCESNMSSALHLLRGLFH